jgi:hypothetical protein
MEIYKNPFAPDSDEYEVWEVLMRNDFEGFLNQNWDIVEADYSEEGFYGINMNKSLSPNDWKLSFPTLDSYKEQWIKDSLDFAENTFISNPREIFYQTTRLENFEFFDHQMMVHKVFNGKIELLDAEPIILKWRSLFILRKTPLGWKIASFCGYINE